MWAFETRRSSPIASLKVPEITVTRSGLGWVSWDMVAVRHPDPHQEEPLFCRVAFEDGDLRSWRQRRRTVFPHDFRRWVKPQPHRLGIVGWVLCGQWRRLHDERSGGEGGKELLSIHGVVA